MHFKLQKLRVLFLVGFILSCFAVQGQVMVPYSLRYQNTLKGDMTMIANNIVNRDNNNNDPEDPYDGDTANDNYNMRYIDIDNDNNTFSSSSATLSIDDIDCSRVVYAALYWSATYRYNGNNSISGRNAFNTVKLKLPGTTTYTSVPGTTIFDGFTNANNAFAFNSPYVCYADVTNLIVNNPTGPNGTYTVADIRASQVNAGQISGGVSGGWTLYVVYENPNLPGKYISSYDGFAAINNATGDVDVNYSGFVTVPAPQTVYAKLIAAALEGDRGINGDRLRFNATIPPPGTFPSLTNGQNPANNFFNGSISVLNAANNAVNFTARNPNSENTLGYDSDIININSGLIPNSATSATLRMVSTQDQYFMFFNALSVDVIEPEIQLVKTVEDLAGENIAGEDVGLGDLLDYVISFDNIGNDDARNFSITDILPVNTSLDSIDLSAIPGAVATQDPVTGEITITIPDQYVLRNRSAYEIRIRVQVAQTCSELTDMCSNIIQNQAYSTYRGVQNGAWISNDPSIAGISDCGQPITGPANFLVDIDNCTFEREEVLCGASLTLTAGDGYTSYQWYNSVDVLIGTTQSITVNSPGEYYVVNTPEPPCVGLTEHITVVAYGPNTTNPLLPFADEVVECPNTGEDLPKFFLCGINDTQLIESGIVNADSIIWEKLLEGSCTDDGLEDCANKNPECTWVQVATGPNFTADVAGEYRMVINYQSGGCFVRHYFNVYKNNLDPGYIKEDLFCSSPGSITVTNVPANYEYRLIDQTTGTELVAYQSNPEFVITTLGVYTVEIRQQGVTDGCVFTLPNIGIMDRDITVNLVVEDKTCHGLGSITINASNVNPQYYYTITGPSTQTTGPLTDNSHTFTGLNEGTYTVTVTTDDDCTFTDTVIINNYSDIQVIAAVTQNVSCVPGTIQLTASGGETPYIYAIYSYNGALQDPGVGDFSDVNPIEIAPGAEGTYQFIVKDANGCTALSNIVVIENLPEVVYTTSFQDLTCNGANNGSITFTVSNTNGFGVSFELFDPADPTVILATNNSGVFTGLAAGDYSVNLVQIGSATCRFTENFTITEPDALTGTASITQVMTCTNGGATIAVDVTSVLGGVAPYEYSIDGINFGSATTFTGLTGGSYTVVIRDANNCTYSIPAIVVTPVVAPSDIAFTATQPVCPALTSDVTLTITDGLAPFNYEITAPAGAVIDNGTNNIFTLSPGTYTFEVTDANGCTITENFTINPVTPIAVAGQLVSNVSCLGSTDGSLSYNVSGFTGNYSYSVTDGGGTVVATATNETNAAITLPSLAANTYTIIVTDNVTNCTATVSVTISAPSAALTLSQTVTPITCLVDGSVTLISTGGWGSNAYSLTLPGGAVVGPQSSPIFTNLVAGAYTGSVSDANGCTVTSDFNLTTPVPPIASLTGSDICYDANGASLTVTVTDGLAPFAYSLNGGASQTSNIFTNLTPGTYTVIVTDANGCTSTAVSQTINPQLTASASLFKGLDCTASPGAEISVAINGGQTAYTYELSINGGSYTAMGAVTGSAISYTTTTSGNYQFRITDVVGCTVQTATINVAPLTMPAITSVTQTQGVICNGERTGAIDVVINTSVGVGPYIIDVVNTTTGEDFNTQTSGLPAGTYTVTVTDSNSCESTPVTIVINQPLPLIYTHSVTPIQCDGSGYVAGQITMSAVSGGTAPYMYYIRNNYGWSNQHGTTSATTHPFDVLDYGIYEVEVIDANGCSFIIRGIEMSSPPEDLTIDIQPLGVDCTVGGSVNITVSAAVTTTTYYEFAILPGNTNDPTTIPAGDWQLANPGTPLTTTFNNLTPGLTYTFVVRDEATDCYFIKQADAPIPTNSNLTSSIDQVNNVTCTGSNDGSVSVTITGFSATTTQVEYQVYEALSNQPVGVVGTIPVSGGVVTIPYMGPLSPDSYFILFTEIDGDVAGCNSASDSFTIVESTNMLVVTASVTANDNCGVNEGSITATGQFGTPPYTYTILPSGSPAPTAVTWTGTSANVFNVEAGSYDVYVKDYYNCIQQTVAPIDVIEDPAPDLALTVLNQCNTAEGSFTLEVSRTAGMTGTVFTYSINGGAFQTQTDTFTYTNLTSGAYTVVIRDSNNCTATESITIYSPLNLTPAVATQPTCATNDGVVVISPIGGSGTFTYELQDSTGTTTVYGPQPGVTFNGVASGAYIAVITDTVTGCSVESPVTLDVPTPVTFTLASTNVSCNGGTDGTITVTLPPVNNNPIYTYAIDNGSTVSVQNGPLFTDLAAGSYSITVTSGRDCLLTETIVITEPNVLTLNASATPFECDADNTVSTSVITATATGGTAPYTYSIDGSNFFTANTFDIVDNGSTQIITVTVVDSNGCEDTYNVTINPLPEITLVEASQQTAITCTNDEVATITVTGGSGDFTFELLPSGPAQTPGSGVSSVDFNLTQPGSYTFQVTDNVTGCYLATIPYEVLPFDTLDVIATSSTPVTCFGDSNGTLTINVTGYSGAYDYEVINASGLVVSGSGTTTTNPFTINNLPAGNHFVTITATDSPFCAEDSNTITVTSPATALTLTAIQSAEVTCNSNQGEIVAAAAGGWGVYEYELINNTTGTTIQAYGSNSVFPGLTAGDYTVYVQDAGGCIVSQTITLTQPTPITASLNASATALLCYGDTSATITAVGVSGGEGVYQYILNTYDSAGTTIVSSTGAQTNPVFTGIGAGIYSITVTDGWDCDITTATVTITQPDPLVASLSLTAGLTCTTQAEVTITAVGGTAPYQFSTDGITYNSTAVYAVNAGTYQYYVRDANNCTAVLTNEVTVLPVTPLALNLDLTGAEINCFGESSAVIVSNATGGLGNYSYTLLDGSNNVIAPAQSSNTFAGLPSGTYVVRVDSGDCNITSGTITITNPPVLEVNPVKTDVLCNGDANGSVTINTTGGTGIIQYAISPNLNQFVNTNVFTGLAPGFHDIIVQDQSGCFEAFQIEILEPEPLVANFGAIQDELCLGVANGSITVEISGGTGDYEVSIDDLSITTDDTLVYVPVTGAQHTFIGLTGGTAYDVYVRDSNGCNVNPPIQYYMNPPVEIIPDIDIDPTCTLNVPGNTVTVNVNTEVEGEVEFSLDNITYQSSNIFTNLAAGTHTIFVRHTNGCVVSEDILIDTLLPVAATAAVTADVLCFGNSTGEITVTATGGTGTLEYSINGGVTYQSSNVFAGLAAGTYDILVRDTIGCEFLVEDTTVDQPTAALLATEVHTPEICLGAADGTVTLTITGGTAPYLTALDSTDPADFTNTVNYTGLAAGTHTVYVVDANGCEFAPVTFTIDAGVDIQATFDPIPTCVNNVPGNVVFIGYNGSILPADLEFSLDGGAYGSDNAFADVTPGLHTASVRHSNGCIDTINITIIEHLPIAATAAVTSDVLCHDGTTGEITVTATDGTGTLSYSIDGGATYQSSNVFAGLTAGNYTVSVIDEIDCEVIFPDMVVTEPTAELLATGLPTDEICLGAGDGTVTLTITGGTAPYSTSLDVDGPTYNLGQLTYNNLTVGTHTVYVVDANGCTLAAPVTFTIDPGVTIDADYVLTESCVANAPQNEVEVTVDASVAADVQYSLDGGAYQSSNIFTNLTAGTHTITVQHTNGCEDTVSVTILDRVPVAATAAVTADVLCFGNSTGEITVTATGGTGALEYSIDGGVTYQSSNVFANLTADTYDILVRDTIGCEFLLEDTTVDQPTAALLVTEVHTPEICLGAADGTVTLTITGGTAPYLTALNSTDPADFTNTVNYTGLTAGTHTVYVADANGCEFAPIAFTIDPGVTINADYVLTESCVANAPQNEVEVTVDASVAADVQYSLDGGAYQSSNIFTNLTAGTHTITVQHTNGCEDTVSVTILDRVPVAATAAVTADVLCFGNSTGEITVTATGGTGALEYSIDGGVTYQSSNVFANLAAGTYNILVRDTIGCEFTTAAVTVNQPAAALDVAYLPTPEICLGAADGTVTLTITGGTAPYLTALDSTDPADFTNTVNYTGLAAGTHTVYVVDANGCEFAPIAFTIDPGVTIDADYVLTESCVANAPQNEVEVTVDASVAADVQYSLDGGAYQSSNIFTNLTAGTHTITVQHTNGCEDTVSVTILDRLPVAATAAVTADVLCFGNSTGEITVTATGGTGTLEYSINGGVTYQSSNVFANLAAGSYTVIVRDTIGCEFTTAAVTVNQPAAALDVAYLPTPEICLGAADGTVTLTITGGTAPYLTALDSTDPADFTNTVNYTGLAAGTHTVYVIDANECEFTPITFTIDSGVTIDADYVLTESCVVNTPQNEVEVMVDASVAADVQYSLDGGAYQSSNIFTNLTAGTHTITVQHTNGCEDTVSVTILDRVPVAATAAATADVLCFGETTGEITVTATGGTGVLEYSLDGVTYQLSNIFTGLTAGSYDVTVRDEIGCEFSVPGIIVDGPTTALDVQDSIQSETCFNAADGEISLVVTGGTAPYFTSLNSNNPADFALDVFTYSGLAAGNHTVYVIDANGCEFAPINFTINAGVNFQVNANTVEICNANVPTTNIVVTVNAAVASQVEYSLDGITYQASNTFVNVAPGNYTVFVQHTDGCIQQDDVIVNTLQPVNASAVAINVSCPNTATGEITVTATGGTGELEYAISPFFNYGTSNVFTGLLAGNYEIRVRDELGCIHVINQIITEPNTPVTATAVATPETCLHADDGIITVSVSGGIAPYSTSLDGVNYVEGQFTFTGLTGGQQYIVFVQDANGCSILAPLVLTVPNGVNMAPTVQVDLNCNNNALGNTVTINMNAGVTGVLEYSLDGITYQSSNVFTDLEPGDHLVYVRHENGCVRTRPFTIYEQKPITERHRHTNVLCNGAEEGTILVLADGGVGDLEYGISPDFEMGSSSTFTNLPAGTYTVRIQDSLGCWLETDEIVITEPSPIQIAILDVQTEICENDDNAYFEISISGGTGPYYTSLNEETGFAADQYLFTDLNGGTEYTIFVKDSNGCETSIPLTLDPPTTINAVAVPQLICEDNKVTVTVDSGLQGAVTYSLNGGTPQTSNEFYNLPNGFYTVEVVHETGCFDITEEFQIINNSPLDLVVSVSGLNEITATPYGGAGGYTYTLNGQDMGSDNVYELYASGTYEVIVTDSAGCQQRGSIPFQYVDIIIPDVTTPNNDGLNDEWGPGNTANYPNITSDIFDRYGRKVATLKQGQTWDGKYNGVEMPSGDYWYIIKLGNPNDDREYVGHFTIYR